MRGHLLDHVFHMASMCPIGAKQNGQRIDRGRIKVQDFSLSRTGGQDGHGDHAFVARVDAMGAAVRLDVYEDGEGGFHHDDSAILGFQEEYLGGEPFDVVEMVKDKAGGLGRESFTARSSRGIELECRLFLLGFVS